MGTERELIVKLTPIDDRPPNSQNLLRATNLEDYITVALTCFPKVQKFFFSFLKVFFSFKGLITTLHFSNYESSIFAQRKPNSRLSFDSHVSFHFRMPNLCTLTVSK